MPAIGDTEYDFCEVVIVMVGKTKMEFMVHPTFLTKSSKFFQACLKKEWAEGKKKTVDLPEVDPEVFSLYLEWLYTGKIARLEQDPGVKYTCEEQEEALAARFTNLRSLAILADKLDEPRLSILVVDVMILTTNASSFMPPEELVDELWNGLPSTSKLRNLLVDFFVSTAAISVYDNRPSSYPTGFLHAVIKALMEDRNSGCKRAIPQMKNRCMYHEHEDGVPKCT